MSGAAGDTATGNAPSAGGFATRHRAWLLIALGFLAAVIVVVLVGGGPRTGTALDPDNPGPDGAQALARVLEDQGVDVTVARGAGALEATEVAADTTVVVTSTELLGETTTSRLLAHARGAPLVLVDAGPGLVDTIGTFEPPRRVTRDRGWEAQCSDPLFADLTVEVDRALAYPGSGCFPDDDGSLIVENGDVRLFGLSEALTNDQILRADNAAAAVRLLGQGDRLGLVRPDHRRPPGQRRRQPRDPAPPLDHARPVAGSDRGHRTHRLRRARRLGPLATEPCRSW